MSAFFRAISVTVPKLKNLIEIEGSRMISQLKEDWPVRIEHDEALWRTEDNQKHEHQPMVTSGNERQKKKVLQ